MANMTFKASLLPNTDLGYSLGSASQRWTIYGNLTGTASAVPWSGITGKPSTTIATSSGTNQITLAFGTKYAITAAGSSYIFTMPSNPNTNTASAVDNILDGSNSGTAITYAPYTAQ